MNDHSHHFSFILREFLTWVLLFLSALLWNLPEWISSSFGGVTIDSILFHMTVPLQGTDTSSIVTFIRMVFLPALCFSLAALFSILLLRALDRQVRRLSASRTGKQVVLRIARSGKKVRRKPISLLPFPSGKGFTAAVSLLFLAEIANLANTLAVIPYLKNQLTPSTWIEENYAPPPTSITWPETKRNLIYIFLESMESSYASSDEGGYYSEDLIPELTALAEDNIHFSNKSQGLGGAIPLPSTTWTMAGMFAQTSGLPLKIPVDGNSMSYYTSFFPGVTSLGDLLENAGYQNYIMFGSDAAFAGRDKYFSQHGNYTIFDYNWAVDNQKIPSDYHVFWGLEDHRLFDMAKEQLTEISASDKPFNFTLLTVDTHFPNGYRCDLCQKEHDTDYKDALSCSSRQVYDFIQWIQQQDFYDNTTIVISGDHLTMSTAIDEEISDSYQRTIYNCILNSAVAPVQTESRTFSTIDMFPTTLAALGVQINGDRLALGTNLFSDKETLLEQYGCDTVSEELQKKSVFFDGLIS